MEAIVRVKETLPIEIITYQNRTTGQTEQLKKKQLILTQGDQVFVAECTGKLAEVLEVSQSVIPGQLCFLSARIYTREFATQDNKRGFATEIQIRSLVAI